MQQEGKKKSKYLIVVQKHETEVRPLRIGCKSPAGQACWRGGVGEDLIAKTRKEFT